MGKENRPVNPFNSHAYAKGFVEKFSEEERKKHWLRQAALKRAEVMFDEVITPRAQDAQVLLAEQRVTQNERQLALIQESNRSTFRNDSLAKITSSISTLFPKAKDERRLYKSKRKGRGWGKWGQKTRAQASQDMKVFIESTSGATLPNMPEAHWEQILKDEGPT